MALSSATIMTDPETIRQALYNSVANWPGYFYGALETVNGLPHVLTIGTQALQVSPDFWKKHIGGTRCPLATNVQITLQTWAHPDGGAVWAYYVQARDTYAIAVQRFGPGQEQSARADPRFRNARLTALDLAKSLVTPL